MESLPDMKFVKKSLTGQNRGNLSAATILLSTIQGVKPEVGIWVYETWGEGWVGLMFRTRPQPVSSGR